MRESGPNNKKPQLPRLRSGKELPKPDKACAHLTAQELHAYYIALISSFRLCAGPDGLRLKAS